MVNDHGTNYWTRLRLSRRRLLQGTTAGVVSLGIAGCAGGTTPTAAPAASTAAPLAPTTGAAASAVPSAPAAVQPKRGGTISTMATLNEQNIDPHALNGAAAGIGATVCYSQLMTYKWGADVKPPSYVPTGDLAESWTQPDDTTYVFKLRSGVKFHNIAPVNGREADADDVRVSYERIIAKKAGAANLAGVSKMEAVDKSTFRLTLDKPNADLLVLLANANSMQIIAKELADQDLAEGPTIGTGAWIFDTFEKGQRIATKRNPDYFIKGTPYADAFVSFRTSDPSQVVNAFRGDSINIVGSGMIAPAGNTILDAIPKATVFWIPLTINPNELQLNVKSDIFRDKRLRQAVRKAIDVKGIIDSVFLGKGSFNAGLLLPDPGWYLPDAEIQKLQGRDLDGARQLLKAAGKENLEFEAVTTTYLQNAYVEMAQIVQANLKEIGVNMTIKTVDPVTHVQLQTNNNFTALFGAFAGGFPNFLLYGRYYTNGPNNYNSTSDPQLDKLIDQQAVLTRDPEKRKSILMDVQREIIDDASHITLAVYQQPTIAQPYIRNFYPPVGLNSHNVQWTTIWVDK